MNLGDFQRDHDLSDDGLAVLISDRSGREITAERVRSLKERGYKRTPKYVREALGLDEQEPPLEPLPSFEESFRFGDEPPVEPAREGADASPGKGGALAPVAPEFDVKTTRQVLVTAYQMVGKGAGYAARGQTIETRTRAQEYERAFDLHAERCADAWIDLAKRDAKVARVLVSLTAGGAWGQVILIHGSLVASLLVVSGKIKMEPVPMAPGLDDDGVSVGDASYPQPA